MNKQRILIPSAPHKMRVATWNHFIVSPKNMLCSYHHISTSWLLKPIYEADENIAVVGKKRKYAWGAKYIATSMPCGIAFIQNVTLCRFFAHSSKKVWHSVATPTNQDEKWRPECEWTDLLSLLMHHLIEHA